MPRDPYIREKFTREQTGSGHGALKPMFDPWCKETTPTKEGENK
jgi:hypothetical protein